MRLLRKGHRSESPFCITPDLLGPLLGVRQEGDAQGNDPLGIRQVPFFEKPVVPRANTRHAQFAILGFGKERASKARHAGRKIHRGPDPPDVHVLDAVVDLPAARANFIEPGGFDSVILARTPRNTHEPHLEIRLALEFPDFVPLVGLDHSGSAVLEFARQPSLKRVWRLDQVVVDGDERVLDRTGLGIRQQRTGHRSFDA